MKKSLSPAQIVLVLIIVGVPIALWLRFVYYSAFRPAPPPSRDYAKYTSQRAKGGGKAPPAEAFKKIRERFEGGGQPKGKVQAKAKQVPSKATRE